MAGDIPNDYQKDFDYLKDKSNKGQLYSDNNIYKKLDDKARNLPGLRRALSTLNIRYK